MKKIIILFILFNKWNMFAQSCTAMYSYGANFEKIRFQNQSIISNAHYFWDFGDGTGSNLTNPIHDYFGNGKFLITLYAHDTVNNCSSYHSVSVNVTKYSIDPCTPFIDDSFFVNSNQNYIKVLDESINCQSFGKNYFSLGGNNGSNTFHLSDYPANFISILMNNNGVISRPAFKSGSWNFNRSKNYTPCSANFEFKVIAEDANSQTILFKAMNKNATSFNWNFSGFGNSILRYSDTATIRFPDHPINSNNPTVTNTPWLVFFTTVGQNGCRDSLIQNIIVMQKSATYVGLNEINKNEIQLKLMPNPVKDKLSLEFETINLKNAKLNIANTLGQIVYSQDNLNQTQEIDLSFLVNGIYYLKIESDEGQKVFKILKEYSN